MTAFREGDRVVINALGFLNYRHYEGVRGSFGNPKCEGVVESYTAGYVRVIWDNGTHNSYMPETLDLAITSLENE